MVNYIKIIIKTLATVFVLITCGCHAARVGSPNNTNNIANINLLISSINALHNEADKYNPNRQRFQKVKLISQTNHVDVNKYFSILKHISPPDDKELDYVYGGQGGPLLYLRRKTEPAIRDTDEYIKDFGKYKEMSEREKAILTELKIDGTKESFVELILFKELAGRFHQPRYYGAPHFVTTVDDIEEIIEKHKGQLGRRFTKEQISAARNIFPAPTVEFNDNNSVTVKLISFDNGNGFIQRIYNVSRISPHKIIDFSFLPLVKYNWGVIVD